MPLSEHEQRLLEQIEQAFYAEDPKFAHSYRTTDLRTLQRRRLIRVGVLFLAGLGLLLAGVITKIISMGVGGFVVMLAAILLGVSSWQRMRRPKDVAVHRATTGRREGERTSVRQRLQQRWERRWDERGR